MKPIAGLTAFAAALVLAGAAHAGTTVPGHSERYDANGNGFPDAGVLVNGHYTSLYAYDAAGDWYWDLGDGRVYGTVGSIDELDGATTSRCNYVVTYRADFGDDPFMNSGWILNDIVCSGYDGYATYTFLIVHSTDPRYTGNPDWAVWGDWEYHVLAESGSGNLVRLAGSAGG